MVSGLVVNEEKGELFVLGHRHVAIEVTDLLDLLDSLVGDHLAEVVMGNLERRLGNRDGHTIRQEQPHASIKEILDELAKADRISGVGVTSVKISQNTTDPIVVEISNPCTKKTTGSARAFASSYYCGILSGLLGRELEVADVTYDEATNVRNTSLVARSQSQSSQELAEK